MNAVETPPATHSSLPTTWSAGSERFSGSVPSLRQVDVAPDYIEKIVSDVLAERRLKIVVDCGNGIPGAIAPQVLEGVGCEVIPLYCDVDGSFPIASGEDLGFAEPGRGHHRG